MVPPSQACLKRVSVLKEKYRVVPMDNADATLVAETPWIVSGAGGQSPWTHAANDSVLSHRREAHTHLYRPCVRRLGTSAVEGRLISYRSSARHLVAP